MKKKGQILLIHGGMTFKNRKDYLHYLQTRSVSIAGRPSWSGPYLDEKLGKRFDIIRPRMPLPDYARYDEWKIHFERLIPLLRPKAILIGNSLGGIFLARYLSENRFPKKLLSVFLICPPFDDTVEGEDLVGGFRLKADLSLLPKNTKHLHLLFSKDDDVVPVSHAEKYRAKLPHADIVIYKSKNGHFQVPRFPELVDMILRDAKNA